MNTVSKLLKLSILLVIVFSFVSPVITFAYGPTTDHSNHTKDVLWASKTDCASSCTQNTYVDNFGAMLEESQRDKEKVPQPDPEITVQPFLAQWPRHVKNPNSCELSVQGIYKYTCAYLF